MRQVTNDHRPVHERPIKFHKCHSLHKPDIDWYELINPFWALLYTYYTYNIYIYIIISYDIPIITSLSPCFSNVFLQLLVLFLIKTQSCGYPDIAEGMWKCRSAMASEPLLSPAVPLRRQNWVQNGWDHRKLWVKPCCCELCEFCWWKKTKSNMELHASPEVS